MAPRRYATRRAPYRRPRSTPHTTRRTRRTRFTRKRFARNNINQLTMRAPLASRLLRVKLPWVKTFSFNASQSYAFQGNAIVPYTVAGQTSNNIPAAGDSLPAGQLEYSTLYDKYFINGSSIKVEAVCTQNSAGSNSLVRAVLLAFPFSTDPSDNWNSNKAQLDSYTYEQLLSWPYAKWRMIAANTGGPSRLVFKMFRKTKNMCGLKDLRDNSEYGSNLSDGLSSSSSLVDNPRAGFMYYLRFFAASGTPPVELTVRMSLYCTLTHREFNPVTPITSA